MIFKISRTPVDGNCWCPHAIIWSMQNETQPPDKWPYKWPEIIICALFELHICKRRYTYDVHENCPVFKAPHPPCSATSKILPPPWTWTSSFKQIPPPDLSLQIITNQSKENITHRWLLYMIRSFLQVGLCFQFQLIYLVWLSIGFFQFSWSQPCPQSYFKKLKTSFSPSSYSEKMGWGQGWAEATLSAFSSLYILVCAVVQKYHEMFFIYNHSHF